MNLWVGEITAKYEPILREANWFFICAHSLFNLLRRKFCTYKAKMIQSLRDFKPRYKNKIYSGHALSRTPTGPAKNGIFKILAFYKALGKPNAAFTSVLTLGYLKCNTRKKMY